MTKFTAAKSCGRGLWPFSLSTHSTPPCSQLSLFLTLCHALVPQNAFKCYVRARDYCTSPRHILNLCLSVIRVSVEMNNYLHVANYVSKAESTPDVANVSGASRGRG